MHHFTQVPSHSRLPRPHLRPKDSLRRQRGPAGGRSGACAAQQPEEAPEGKEDRPPASALRAQPPGRTFMNSSLSKQSVLAAWAGSSYFSPSRRTPPLSANRGRGEERRPCAYQPGSRSQSQLPRQRAPLRPTWQRPHRGQSARAPRAGFRPPLPRGTWGIAAATAL